MRPEWVPYGAGTVAFVERNRRHPYCARRYKGSNKNRSPLYRVIGYFVTEEEAWQALLEVADKSEEDLSNADMTFSELLDHFVGMHDELSKITIRTKVGCAKGYCKHLMNVPYREIRADDMREVLRTVDSTGRKQQVKSLFSSLDREAESLDIPGKRYAQFLAQIRPKKDDSRPEKVPFTENEMQMFLEHRKERDMDLALFLCYTGFREGAFRKIRKENVDLDAMTVTGGIKTKAGLMRTIPLHPNIQPIVARMMEKPGEYLLTNEYGKPMSEPELTGRYLMAIAPYTNRHHYLHECRHTFYNKLQDQHVEGYVIDVLMGHAPQDAGQRHYARVSIDRKRESIMKLWE
ncbi:MAG: tyrosine-type recombinase/integrase [Lachnospiraceae bacterium]|nr:tyrosine-type recombinase/integrase [Lachnospiraceae bacterium]